MKIRQTTKETKDIFQLNYDLRICKIFLSIDEKERNNLKYFKKWKEKKISPVNISLKLKKDLFTYT